MNEFASEYESFILGAGWKRGQMERGGYETFNSSLRIWSALEGDFRTFFFPISIFERRFHFPLLTKGLFQLYSGVSKQLPNSGLRGAGIRRRRIFLMLRSAPFVPSESVSPLLWRILWL